MIVFYDAGEKRCHTEESKNRPSLLRHTHLFTSNGLGFVTICHVACQRSNPLGEDGCDGVIAMRVDAAHLTATFIKVKEGIQRFPLLPRAERSGCGRDGCSIGKSELTEVLLDISGRAKFTLFLATPKSDANGSLCSGVQRFQDAHGFHCYYRSPPHSRLRQCWKSNCPDCHQP